MTLRHLRIFVEVYQNSSISVAAQNLYISQPAVSISIKELETEYATSLFDRMNRKLYPTAQGDLLYSYAVHIISSFDEVTETMRSSHDYAPLRIGTSVTIGNFLLPQMLVKYKELYPHIKINAMVHNSAKIEQEILDNHLDFGLIEGRPKSQQIVKKIFLEDRICFICPPNHPLLTASSLVLLDLVRYPFLLRERGSATRMILDGLLQYQQLSVHVLLESASTQAIVRAVQNSLGITALPRLLVQSEIDSGTVCEVPIELPELNRHFYLIMHKNKQISKNALDFIKLLH